MDASETFKALHISKRRAALTRFFPRSLFLNLLERDAQFFAKLVLAHTERQPLLAHPTADVSVYGTCTFRREFFRVCLLHTFSLAQKTLRAPPYKVPQVP
jgi:hypothetical protein